MSPMSSAGRLSDMKRARQYIGILAAVVSYYCIHEGAHLIIAVLLGAFKQIRFLGIGLQIDVYAERMTNIQITFLTLFT